MVPELLYERRQQGGWGLYEPRQLGGVVGSMLRNIQTTHMRDVRSASFLRD